MATSSDKCPVDHSSFSRQSSSDDACPVDHTAKRSWTDILSRKDKPSSHAAEGIHPNGAPASLAADREISSIPRTDGTKWVYPSQSQFYAAMARKNHNPQASDMKVIVPIHNAVNERAWAELMKWEGGQGGDKCGGVKLVSFKGRPNDRTPKAWVKTLLGYSAPFDRHDWVVDRCGTRIRYVIDFYTGHSRGPSSNNLSFYLDVRPAVDNWEGVRMRAQKFWERWVGSPWTSPSSPPTQTSS